MATAKYGSLTPAIVEPKIVKALSDTPAVVQCLQDAQNHPEDRTNTKTGNSTVHHNMECTIDVIGTERVFVAGDREQLTMTLGQDQYMHPNADPNTVQLDIATNDGERMGPASTVAAQTHEVRRAAGAMQNAKADQQCRKLGPANPYKLTP